MSRESLVNKVAIVTGGTRGIGKAIVYALYSAGSRVFICGNKHSPIDFKDRPNLDLEKADVTSPEQIKRLFEKIKEKNTGIDILVNNVGGLEKFGRFEDLTDLDWLNAFNLNLMSMVRFCRLAIPYLKRSPAPRIINISSLVAHQPGKFNPHYGVAKAGMLFLSKYLSNELAEHGILVNTICPGIIRGGGWVTNIKDRAKRDKISREKAEEKMIKEGKKKIPLGKLGEVRDIAELVVFLASERAGFITGQVFDVDGGMNKSIL